MEYNYNHLTLDHICLLLNNKKHVANLSDLSSKTNAGTAESILLSKLIRWSVQFINNPNIDIYSDRTIWGKHLYFTPNALSIYERCLKNKLPFLNLLLHPEHNPPVKEMFHLLINEFKDTSDITQVQLETFLKEKKFSLIVVERIEQKILDSTEEANIIVSEMIKNAYEKLNNNNYIFSCVSPNSNLFNAKYKSSPNDFIKGKGLSITGCVICRLRAVLTDIDQLKIPNSEKLAQAK